MTSEEAFAALGVPSTATLEELQAAFRHKASRMHPDKFFTPGERAVATRRFQRIAEAYELLRRALTGSNKERREQSTVRTHYEPPIPRDESLPDSWDLLEDIKDRAPLVHLLFELLWVFMLLPMVLMTGILSFAEAAKVPFRIVALLNTLVLKVLAPAATIWLGFYGLERTPWSSVLIVAGALHLALEAVAQIIGIARLRQDAPQLSLVLSRLPDDDT